MKYLYLLMGVCFCLLTTFINVLHARTVLEPRKFVKNDVNKDNLSNTNEDNVEYTEYKKQKNVIILSLGGASNSAKTSTFDEPYEEDNDYKFKENAGLTYFNYLTTNFALGFNLEAFASNGVDEEEISQVNTNQILKINDVETYSMLTNMMVVSYKFIDNGIFNLNGELGFGLAFNAVDVNLKSTTYNSLGVVTSKTQLIKDTDTYIEPISKIGVSASFHLTQHFSLGLGSYYYLTSKNTNFKINNINFSVKKGNISLVNLQAIFTF